MTDTQCGCASDGVANPSADVDWGSLRRVDPVSQVWGIDRGFPIDRYYIDLFLNAHRSDIAGRVLEVRDPLYTYLYGVGVEHIDVLDNDASNPAVTVLADLEHSGSLPPDSFDCFMMTQTMHVTYDVRTVVANAHQALRTGGVLLASLPCVSRIDPEAGLNGDYWRFTPASAKRLFESEFGPGAVDVTAFGNVLACVGFLYGLGAGELSNDELNRVDPNFPLLSCVRARRAPADVEMATAADAHH